MFGCQRNRLPRQEWESENTCDVTIAPVGKIRWWLGDAVSQAVSVAEAHGASRSTAAKFTRRTQSLLASQNFSGNFANRSTLSLADGTLVNAMTTFQEMDNMEAIARKLWNDEAGFIVTLELILIATIVVIGLITGLVTVRNAVVQELSDVAGAVQDMNQTYYYNAIASPNATTSGSLFLDTMDSPEDVAGDAYAESDNGIVFFFGPEPEIN